MSRILLFLATIGITAVSVASGRGDDYNQGYDYNQGPEYNQGYGQSYDQSYDQGYNQGYGQSYNQGYNQGYDQGSDYNQGYDQGSDYNQGYGYDREGSCYPPQRMIIPIYFPLADDGFTETESGSANATSVAKRANGVPPNSRPEKPFSPDTLISFQLIAFAGIFEVAFILYFIEKIVAGDDGFPPKDPDTRDYTLATLQVIYSQAEQYVLSANQELARADVEPIKPCRYYWPATVDDYDTAVTFFSLFSQVVLGALQDINRRIGENRDFDLLPVITSVAEAKAEQVGWLRSIEGQPASSNPYPTTGTREFLYSFIYQQVLVPGSCPKSNYIDLQVFQGLVLVEPLLLCKDNGLIDQIATLSFQGDSLDAIRGSSVVYVNQLLQPIPAEIMNPSVYGGCIEIEAVFPCNILTFSDGLTFILLSNRTADYKYKNVRELTAYVTNGPALNENN